MLDLTKDKFSGFHLNIGGYVLVYFKQNKCRGCTLFDSVFLNIAAETAAGRTPLKNVEFATYNISGDPNIAENSGGLLTNTPSIILFLNGVFMGKYCGQSFNAEEIIQFAQRAMIDKSLPPDIHQYVQHAPARQIYQPPPPPPQQHSMHPYAQVEPNRIPSNMHSYPPQMQQHYRQQQAPQYIQPQQPPPQPQYMSALRGGNNNAGKQSQSSGNQIYVHNEEGLFSNWKYLTPKDKPWRGDHSVNV